MTKITIEQFTALREEIERRWPDEQDALNALFGDNPVAVTKMSDALLARCFQIAAKQAFETITVMAIQALEQGEK